MSAYLINEIQFNPTGSPSRPARAVVDGGGDGRLEWIDLDDTSTGVRTRREAGGLFLLLGAVAHCDWLPPEVALDERGFVLTGRDVPAEGWSRRSAAREPRRPRFPASSPSATSVRAR